MWPTSLPHPAPSGSGPRAPLPAMLDRSEPSSHTFTGTAMHPHLVRPSCCASMPVVSLRLGAAALLLWGTVACRSSTGTSGSQGIRVLFVGNSLTDVNDLPRMFEGVAAAGG